MKFQIGDKILLLHSNEEGEVTDIINDKMVMVDVEGVKFPAYIDQIDFPYFKRFTEKGVTPAKKEKKYIEDVKKETNRSAEKKEDGVWLSFIPVMKPDETVDEVVQELKLHLLNQTSRLYKFIYELHFFGRPDFDLRNELHPFEDFYLHDIAFEAMNDSPSFEFKFSLKQPEKNKAEYQETSLRLKPKQLFAKLKALREKNEAFFSYRLFESYPDKKEEPEFYFPKTKKHVIYDLSKVRQHLEPARSVIDLHIEKLADDWRHLSNFEMLTLQLKTFEKYYDLAILHLQPSLTVIHGIGSGKLRDEIHEILRRKKEVKSFVNQYHPLYGFGATEIFFKY
ncbi:MAG TPA: Smr/MutS family protein [Chitinophagaceae bacterium]|nr:Smr/MutS family protein [Chitinophagaceae bacterium]